MKIHSIQSEQQIQQVAELAEQIWQSYFTPLIGAEQVAYMLHNFQSQQAIAQQISEGVLYFAIANSRAQNCGYMALIANPSQRKVMLSKLYVQASDRSQGFGRALLNLAEQTCEELYAQELWLTVNRYNHSSIEWYQRQGFRIVDEVKKDIGNGFFMDDFIMAKAID